MKKASNISPLVTVIVAIYNVSEYLEKCIKSILSQSYKNLEIILVNDGSTDASGSICDKYKSIDKRIVVIHKENGGLSSARNAGIDKAKGSYIAFIDGDDYVQKSYIKDLLDEIISTGSDISVAGHTIIRESGSIDKCASRKRTFQPEQALEEILYDREIDLSAWGKLYSAKLFTHVRFPNGQLYEDSATTYLLFDASNKIAVIPTPLYNYIIRKNSITNCNFNEKKLDLISSTAKMTHYVLSKYPKLKQACERRMMWAHLSTLAQLAKANHPKKTYIQKLMAYINEHRSMVLKDKNLNRRDRFSLHITRLGFGAFRLVWKLYEANR